MEMKRLVEAGVVGDGEKFEGEWCRHCLSDLVGLGVGPPLCLHRDLILGLTLKNPSN